MVKAFCSAALLSTALLLAFCTASQAAPSASTRQASATGSTQKYWLSDGLNRLVFWRPSATSQHEKAR